MPLMPSSHVLQHLYLRLWWAIRWQVPPSWRVQRRLRPPYTNIWYVRHGVMGVALNGQKAMLSPGTLAIIPPDVTAESWNAAAGELEFLSLGCECRLNDVDVFLGLDPIVMIADLGPRVQEIWLQLEALTQKLQESPTPPDHLRLSGLLRLWWAEIMEATGLDFLQRLNAMDPRVVEALGWMRRHLHVPLRLVDVAHHVHVSPSHLRQLFVDGMGISFREALLQLRMQKAKLLLLNSELSISEVARQVGYQDPHHFSRAFSRAEGITPTFYRLTATQRVPVGQLTKKATLAVF